MKNSNNEMLAFAILGLVVLLLGLVLVGPIATIFALQTLGVPLKLTFWTWLSVAWLHFLAYQAFQPRGGKKE